MQRFHDERDRFFERRYGLFVHWGLYAINGYHEQEIYRRLVPRPQYEQLMGRFCPRQFDPERWLDDMQAFGMQYLVFTAKHIDGFCMWDTAHSPFNVMRTPFGRDVVGELSLACQRRGMPFGLYYSLADMNHKSYPHRDRSYEYPAPQPGDRPDADAYLAYVRSQITELMTSYGPICCLFWDAPVMPHKDPDMNALVRRLQPGCVINDRGYDAGDYKTPERDFDKENIDKAPVFDAPTEACQAIGMESWGYRSNEKFYASRYLMQSMDKILARGGNYLLNVGPNADGVFGEGERAVLRRIAAWLSSVRPAIYGATPSPAMLRYDGALLPVTVCGTDVFVHFPNGFTGDSVLLDTVLAVPASATLQNTGAPLRAERSMGVRNWFYEVEPLRVSGIPVEDTYGTVPVIRLSYDDLPGMFR